MHAPATFPSPIHWMNWENDRVYEAIFWTVKGLTLVHCHMYCKAMVSQQSCKFCQSNVVWTIEFQGLFNAVCGLRKSWGGEEKEWRWKENRRRWWFLKFLKYNYRYNNGTVYFSIILFLVWYSFHVYTWHNLLELEPLYIHVCTQYTVYTGTVNC